MKESLRLSLSYFWSSREDSKITKRCSVCDNRPQDRCSFWRVLVKDFHFFFTHQVLGHNAVCKRLPLAALQHLRVLVRRELQVRISFFLLAAELFDR